MPFDFAFDFRSTAGYVTDPSYAVPVLFETFPHTYINADGKSIDAGWVMGANGDKADEDNTNDPRIAGVNYVNDGGTGTFRIDLSSGSNPGAGDYIIDLAVGIQSGGPLNHHVDLRDGVTSLIAFDATNLATDDYKDATGATVTATGTWTGATVQKTFAGTTVNLVGNPNSEGGGSSYICFAHLRLTLVESSPPPPPPPEPEGPATNPWVFTTTDTSVTTAELRPKRLVWTGDDIADGDELTLLDLAGRVVFSHFATAADTGIIFKFPKDTVWRGFAINALPHGSLYLYF